MVLLHSQTLPINWPAPDFNLRGTDNESYSLADLTNKQGMLIVFTCNHCPYAQASWPTLIELANEFSQTINFIAINSNDPSQYPEDSFEQMQKLTKEHNLPFPYLFDETQKTAKEYEAQCTPDPYLFKNNDGEFKLFYHGRVNDNWQTPTAVQEHSLKQAIQALINHQSPPQPQHPSMGCSIKWK